MIEKDDWRLLNDVEYLKGKCINPTNSKEISRNAPYLKHCVFCWDKVLDSRLDYWFVPEDLSCCICDECWNDFKEEFNRRMLDGWDLEWE